MPLKSVECEALVCLGILDSLLIGDVPPAGPHYSRPGVEDDKVRMLHWEGIVRDSLGRKTGVVDVDHLEVVVFDSRVTGVHYHSSKKVLERRRIEVTFLLTRDTA